MAAKRRKKRKRNPIPEQNRFSQKGTKITKRNPARNFSHIPKLNLCGLCGLVLQIRPGRHLFFCGFFGYSFGSV